MPKQVPTPPPPSLRDDAWWDDPDECVTFARWLIVDGALTSAVDALAFFEKPWKWDPEHDTYLSTLGEGNDGI